MAARLILNRTWFPPFISICVYSIQINSTTPPARPVSTATLTTTTAADLTAFAIRFATSEHFN